MSTNTIVNFSDTETGLATGFLYVLDDKVNAQTLAGLLKAIRLLD